MVDVLLSAKAGTVAGMARHANNQAAPFAGVVLIPADRDGRFAFRNVAPGEYRVFAWEEADSLAWLDVEAMKPLQGMGVLVSVVESGQVSVQVNVIAPSESGSPTPRTVRGQ